MHQKKYWKRQWQMIMAQYLSKYLHNQVIFCTPLIFSKKVWHCQMQVLQVNWKMQLSKMTMVQYPSKYWQNLVQNKMELQVSKGVHSMKDLKLVRFHITWENITSFLCCHFANGNSIYPVHSLSVPSHPIQYKTV